MGLRLQILIKPIAPSHGDGALVHVDVHGPAVALAGPVPWPQLAVPLSWGLLLRALDVSHGVPCEAANARTTCSRAASKARTSSIAHRQRSRKCGAGARRSQPPAPASWLQRSIRWLQPGRIQPLGDASAGFGLPGFADYTLTFDAGWKRFGFLTEALHLFGKALFKGRGLLEPALLHGAAPFQRRRERWWRPHHR